MAKLRARIDVGILRREYVENGLSLTAIAAKYGWSVNTLRRRLNHERIKFDDSRRYGGRRGTGKFKLLADRNWLAAQLRSKTMLQIAKELGTTSGNVSDFAKRHSLRLADNASDAIKIGKARSR